MICEQGHYFGSVGGNGGSRAHSKCGHTKGSFTCIGGVKVDLKSIGGNLGHHYNIIINFRFVGINPVSAN